MKKIVATQYARLSQGDENQHLAFDHVTPEIRKD